jgi:hypothetical protein
MQVTNPNNNNGLPYPVVAQNLNENGVLPVQSSVTFADINVGSQIQYHLTQPGNPPRVHLFLNAELNPYWQTPGRNQFCPVCNQFQNVWIPATVTGA